jgi:hypothetical protein
MNSKLEAVRELVAKHSGRRLDQLQPSTQLFHDLAIDGDTAEELLLQYCEQFALPVDTFPFAKYFGGEVGAGWRHFLMVRLGICRGRLQPLTIEQLAEWAQRGAYGDSGGMHT